MRAFEVSMATAIEYGKSAAVSNKEAEDLIRALLPNEKLHISHVPDLEDLTTDMSVEQFYVQAPAGRIETDHFKKRAKASRSEWNLVKWR